MSELIIFNKPYSVLSQFTDKSDRTTLAKYIKKSGFYPAGRLDYDSEGLLLLTNSGALQARISHPQFKMPKTYWVQVEGEPTSSSLEALRQGVELKDGKTRPAKVNAIPEPSVWERTPPIRQRKNDLTTWLEITISEGKNRQVRRMTAHIGHPTLRLIRYSIGNWTLESIMTPGQMTLETVHLPHTNSNEKQRRPMNNRNRSSGRNTPRNNTQSKRR